MYMCIYIYIYAYTLYAYIDPHSRDRAPSIRFSCVCQQFGIHVYGFEMNVWVLGMT